MLTAKTQEIQRNPLEELNKMLSYLQLLENSTSMKALGHDDVPPPGTSRKPKLNPKSIVVRDWGSHTVTVPTVLPPLRKEGFQPKLRCAAEWRSHVKSS